jgi:hypothetical protein
VAQALARQSAPRKWQIAFVVQHQMELYFSREPVVDSVGAIRIWLNANELNTTVITVRAEVDSCMAAALVVFLSDGQGSRHG